MKQHVQHLATSQFKDIEWNMMTLGLSTLDLENDVVLANDLKDGIQLKIGESYNAQIIYFDYKSSDPVTLESESGKPIVQITYRNVAEIGGRKVNAIVMVQKVEIGRASGSYAYNNKNKNLPEGIDSPRCGLVGIYNGQTNIGPHIGAVSASAPAGPKGYPYTVSANTVYTMSMEIQWADTNEPLSSTCVMNLTDIDINNTAGYNTVESFSPVSGFTGNFYDFEGTDLVYDIENVPGNGMVRIYNGVGVNRTGDDSTTKAGVFAPTTSGKFSFIMTEGQCATVLTVSVPVSETSVPTKDHKVVSAEGDTKSKIDAVGDTIHYTIDYKMGEWLKNVWECYPDLTITDTVPNGLAIIRGTGKVSYKGNAAPDTMGTLTLTSTTMKYELAESWIKTPANYDGGVITIEFDCKAEEFKPEYINQAYSIIKDDEMPSNRVKDEPEFVSPKYVYVSGMPDIALPPAISTTSGIFIIVDDSKYLKGETAVRNNDVKVSATYTEKRNGKVLRTWKLISWDKDSGVIYDNDLTFVGTWVCTFPEPPKTGDSTPVSLYMTLALISLAGIALLFKFRRVRK